MFWWSWKRNFLSFLTSSVFFWSLMFSCSWSMTSIYRFFCFEISVSLMRVVMISLLYRSTKSFSREIHTHSFFCVCWFHLDRFFSFETSRYLVVLFSSIDWISSKRLTILNFRESYSLISKSLSFCWRRCIVVFVFRISLTWSSVDTKFFRFFFVSLCILFFMNCVLLRIHSTWSYNQLHTFSFSWRAFLRNIRIVFLLCIALLCVRDDDICNIEWFCMLYWTSNKLSTFLRSWCCCSTCYYSFLR